MADRARKMHQRAGRILYLFDSVFVSCASYFILFTDEYDGGRVLGFRGVLTLNFP